MHQGGEWGPSLTTCFLIRWHSFLWNHKKKNHYIIVSHCAVHANHHCVIHALHQEAALPKRMQHCLSTGFQLAASCSSLRYFHKGYA